MGDEAIVETASFSLEGRAVRKVRQSVARLEKAGYRAGLFDVVDLDDTTFAALERVSDAWRGGTAERGFSMALDALRRDDQEDTVVVIAQDAAGEVRGFLHFVPSYGRKAMSLSLMRRERNTPNGLTEFMVVKSIELLRARGIEELSLNFAAFARFLHSPRGWLEQLAGGAARRADASSRSSGSTASTRSSSRAGSRATQCTGCRRAPARGAGLAVAGRAAAQAKPARRHETVSLTSMGKRNRYPGLR